MTSNGTPLARLAQALKTAGLDDLNISIDAINEARFAELAQDDLRQVLDGILAARVRGLALKLNVVIVRGRNESEISEILPLAEWAFAQRMPLRYLEFMPLDARGDWSPQKWCRRSRSSPRSQDASPSSRRRAPVSRADDLLLARRQVSDRHDFDRLQPLLRQLRPRAPSGYRRALSVPALPSQRGFKGPAARRRRR
jgi:cyclic pyranopterin phosphate synthase